MKGREEQAVCQNLLICCLIGKCGRNYFTLILDPESVAKIPQEYLLCCLISATLYMWTQKQVRVPLILVSSDIIPFLFLRIANVH